MTAPRLFLATDFGLDDEFVGVLHAVVARVAPDVRVIDLAHGIAPFDVAGGAALLARAAPYLGPGVVCAVVDPGVGTSRRAIALEVSGAGPHYLVGPDNGLLLDMASCLGGVVGAVELDAPTRSHRERGTFDGRDVFAPCAARLAMGAALDELGDPIDPSSLASLATAAVVSRPLDDGRTVLTTEVRWIDRYGNVQLSLPGRVLEAGTMVGLVVGDDDTLAPVVRAYADLEVGALGVLCDANDAVAIVVRQGSAAAMVGVDVGDRVELVGPFGPLH